MKPLFFALASAAILLLSACHHQPPVASGPLPQRGYLWQRAWSPSVIDAFPEAEKRMDGIVILGAEIVWTGKTAATIRATVDWNTLRAAKKPVAIALRVAPFPGPFAVDDPPARAIAATAKSLLAAAKAHGVELSEFQLDFDCAQQKLAGFRLWIRALRPVIQPVRFVITTLPAWLDEPEFPALIRDVDGYVLQVHSVPTLAESEHALLCDTTLARKWVAKAAHLGLPFSVALPTYRCLAGYDPVSGKLLGVAMDSVQPAWPPGTRLLDFATNAEEIAALIREWQTARPPQLRELLWYRLPTAADTRNWRWPTLSAVMAGRAPARKLEIVREGENPVDLSLSNTGEADDQRDAAVTVTWSGATLTASDALPGWIIRTGSGQAIFTQAPGIRAPLPPGSRRSIGWLRFDRPTPIHIEVKESTAPPALISRIH